MKRNFWPLFLALATSCGIFAAQAIALPVSGHLSQNTQRSYPSNNLSSVMTISSTGTIDYGHTNTGSIKGFFVTLLLCSYIVGAVIYRKRRAYRYLTREQQIMMLERIWRMSIK